MKNLEFIKYLEAEKLSITTQLQYDNLITNFLSYVNEREVTIELIKEFLNGITFMPTRIRYQCAIKKYLIFLKSPVLFEMKDVKE